MKSQFQLGKKKEAEDSEKESNKLEMNTQLAVEVETLKEIRVQEKKAGQDLFFLSFHCGPSYKEKRGKKRSIWN